MGKCEVFIVKGGGSYRYHRFKGLILPF